MSSNDEADPVECPRCMGYGDEPGAPNDIEDGTALCLTCGGTGEITAALRDAMQGTDDHMVRAVNRQVVERGEHVEPAERETLERLFGVEP